MGWLSAAKQSNAGSTSDVVALVHSHHLLDHKPDNLVLKGGRYRLRGVACLGRPGVALCIGPRTSIDKFSKALQSAMPQKKFNTVELSGESETESDQVSGFEAVTIGELRGLLAALGHEDQFFAITGLDPSNAKSSNTVDGGSSNGTKDGTKGGKKKRRKR